MNDMRKGSDLSIANALEEHYRSLDKKDTRPNILFIITDQQHAGMMSCTGNKWLGSPALDALARDGIRYELAYSTNPVCVPSRISMATGMMPNQLGASDNKQGMKIEELPPEVNEYSLGKPPQLYS